MKRSIILSDSQDKLAWWGERLMGMNLHQTNLQVANRGKQAGFARQHHQQTVRITQSMQPAH